MKKLTPKIIASVEAGVYTLLKEARRLMRDNGEITSQTIRFDINNPYYCEAFGVMRGLEIVGYGTFEANNLPAEKTNLKWWFAQLENKVLWEDPTYDHELFNRLMGRIKA